MILILPDMPEGTIGLEAVGEVTGDDFREVVAPALERRLPDQRINALLLLDERFETVAAGAVVQDVRLWLDRLGDWERVAVVTDHDAVARPFAQVASLGSGTVRVFPLDSFGTARAWVVEGDGED